MIKGFKEFILRGNVLDLAVAVVIGAAFTALIGSVVTNIINPVIGAVFNAKSLDKSLILTVGNAHIAFGAFIGAVINFLIIALIVYFVFVYPLNLFKERAAARKAAGEPEAEDVPATELDLLSEIRDLLARGPAEEVGGGKHQG